MTKMLSRNGWGRAVHLAVISAILITHCVPRSVQAADPPVVSVPGLPFVLTDERSADDLAEQLAGQVRGIQRQAGLPSQVGWRVRVRFVHVEGQAEDERVRRIVTLLSRQSIPIDGEIISKQEFDARAAQIQAEAASEPHHPLSVLLERGEIPKQPFWTRVRYKAEKLFGLAKGFTYFQLYLAKAVGYGNDPRVEFVDNLPEAPWKLFHPKYVLDHLFYLTCASSAAYFLTKARHAGQPAEEWMNWDGLGAPGIALFAWVYLYLVWFRYISLLRFMGITPYWVTGNDSGSQLQAKAERANNWFFYFGAALGPEIFINALIYYLILNGQPLGGWELLGASWAVLRNAGLSAFASQPIETVVGKVDAAQASEENAAKVQREMAEQLESHGEHSRAGEAVRSASRHRVRGWMLWGLSRALRGVWNLRLFPEMKNFDLQQRESWVGSAAFLVVGVAGMLVESVREGWFGRGRLKVSPEAKANPARCSDVIVIDLIEEKVRQTN